MAKQMMRRIGKNMDQLLREEKKRLQMLTGDDVSFTQASDSLMNELSLLRRKVKKK